MIQKPGSGTFTDGTNSPTAMSPSDTRKSAATDGGETVNTG